MNCLIRKNLILILISLFFSTSVLNAQIPWGELPPNANPFQCNPNTNLCNYIRNNTFALSCADPTNPANGHQPFVNCVAYWSYSHGTAQISRWGSLYAPGVNHASMRAGFGPDPLTGVIRSNSEGIAVGVKRLTANSTFKLSFKKRYYSPNNNKYTPDLDNYYVVLLTCAAYNNIRVPDEDYAIPQIPTTGSQVIYVEANTSNTTWQTVEQYFTTNGAYDVVWIFPQQATGPDTEAWLEIAEPELIKAGTCGVTPPPCSVSISPKGPINYYVFTDAGVLGRILTSSSSTGNQWYYNGIPISGATGQTYTVGSGYSTIGSGTYYVVNNGCTSNVVQVQFKQYGYGNFGEDYFDRLGAKVHPIQTSNYYCYNTNNNSIQQFNLGAGSNYNWNFFVQPSGGTQNISLTPGSYSPSSNLAQLDIGSATPGTYTSIQGIANLNGAETIIDYTINLSHPSFIPTTTQVCQNAGHNIINWSGSSYSTVPGGSGFDWEYYDFGTNGIIFSGLGAGNSSVLIPGRSTPQNMIVKFTGPSSVQKHFYYNYGGCYKEEYSVTINPGCRISGIESNQIAIFPNPSNSQVTISSSTDAIIKIEILGLMNLYVKTIQGNNERKINLSLFDLKPGIYNCRVTTSKGTQNQKLVIKR